MATAEGHSTTTKESNQLRNLYLVNGFVRRFFFVEMSMMGMIFDIHIPEVGLDIK